MTDISPLTSGTPARRTSTRAVVSYTAAGALIGGLVVSMVGLVPLIFLAVAVLVIRGLFF